MYLLWNFRTFLLFHDWRSLSELESRKRRLVSHTMSDDDYVVQRMLDGESEEDEDEPNDTNVELPLGAGRSISNDAAEAAGAAGTGAVVAQDLVMAAAAAVCAGASSAACGERLLLAATHLGHRIDAPSKVSDALMQLLTRHLASDGIARLTWGNASGIVGIVPTLCGALDRAWEDSRQRNSFL